MDAQLWYGMTMPEEILESCLSKWLVNHGVDIEELAFLDEFFDKYQEVSKKRNFFLDSYSSIEDPKYFIATRKIISAQDQPTQLDNLPATNEMDLESLNEFLDNINFPIEDRNEICWHLTCFES